MANKKAKYLSVRKALQELKVNEDELKKIVESGKITPIYENNEAKFDENDIEKIKTEVHEDLVIADENLYESTDGTYDSLFLSRSTVAIAEELAASEMLKDRIKEENIASAPKEIQELLQKSLEKKVKTPIVSPLQKNFREKDLLKKGKESSQDSFAKTRSSYFLGEPSLL